MIPNREFKIESHITQEKVITKKHSNKSSMCQASLRIKRDFVAVVVTFFVLFCLASTSVPFCVFRLLTIKRKTMYKFLSKSAFRWLFFENHLNSEEEDYH